MKKYKVTATPITPIIPDVEAHEYIVFAEDEEGAKQKAFDQMLAEELNDALLDSPTQMLTAEEVGYFYGHKYQPHHMCDLIDNLEVYIAEMRETEDMETIPKWLKQYAWNYFRDVSMDKKDLQRMAVFVVDRTYRIISNDMTMMDNYTKSYFASVMPYLWDALQNRGIDTFYIVDNEIKEDRFHVVTELFRFTGMGVVTPYGEDGNLEYEVVKKQIKDYMGPVRNIMYIEKDASINYLDRVKDIAKESKYLCIFRNHATDDPNVEVSNSEL